MTIFVLMERPTSVDADEAHQAAAGEVTAIRIEQIVVPIAGRSYAEQIGYRKVIDDVDLIEQGISDERERAETFWERCRRRR